MEPKTTEQQKIPISLVIITLNEERGIARAIQSARFCSEIIVVDSGSTDQTCQIAMSLGAKVINEPWRGFRAQKQFATDQAQNTWVLSLDGDEWLSKDLEAEIQSFFLSSRVSNTQIEALRMPRKSWTMGRWINFGGWRPDYQTRLFKKTSVRWGGGEFVHEHVDAKNIVDLESELLHEPFKDLADQVTTNNRYSTLGSENLQRSGMRFSLFRLLTKPLSKFLETYIIKMGFRDGLPGFVIAVGAAYSVFLKFAKLWEAESKATAKRP